jgi:cytochrome c oxidase subunit IV
MNNPPDVSPDPAEHEEYAHNVQKHVKGYLIVGAILLVATGVTVALSYFDFGNPKANIAVAMLVAVIKVTFVGAVFMHLAAEKRLIYRVLLFTGIFVLGLFWLTYLAWYNPVVR